MENNTNDTIDLLQLFYAVREKIWLVIMTGLIFAFAAAGFTKFFITPTYTSTATMLVLTKETTLTSLADLQLGSQLTKDYTVLITSRPVLQDVIENLELDMNYKQLRNCVTVENPSDTRILTISATQEDPRLAKTVVDELAQVSSAYIGDKMEVTPPKIIEEGEVSAVKTSPNMLKNVTMGFLLGVMLVCVIVCVLEIMNDSIQSEEDIENYLGIPTLAVVPDKMLEPGSKGTKKKKKKRKK